MGKPDATDAAEATHNVEALSKAMAVAGLFSADGTMVICPGCGKPAKVGSKIKLQPSGMYKHFSKDGCTGDAISVLRSRFDVGFWDAANFLVGKTTKFEFPEAQPVDIALSAFVAQVDTNLNGGMFHYGTNAKIKGVEAAVAYYGQWHIGADAVKASGAVLIPDPAHLAQMAKQRYGDDKLLACGWASPNKEPGSPAWFLVSDRYPVLEPHHHPDGRILFVQLRASNAQLARIAQHRAGQIKYPGDKFLSLRGVPRSAQVGTGLAQISAAKAGTTIYVVEGFKDALAAATMGSLAYGVPGVDYRPGELALSVLRDKDVQVCFDGDEAGQTQAEPMAQYLRENGVERVTVRNLPPGYDVTDRLVGRYAAAGCRCDACQEILARQN